eukprot:TRINITY_DN4104_c0_g1_i1.p1 TRINITY_DN4104_c0_g1~~TRINITY_DN4104_c0_g1_i1.p1  ORF type:complete len:848 (+),score=205.28 TRINITY_DN4104_c0_g1_i1:87-2546(+)
METVSAAYPTDLPPPQQKQLELFLRKNEGEGINIAMQVTKIKKGRKKQTQAILAFTTCKAFVFSPKLKLQHESHFLELQNLTSQNDNEVTLQFKKFTCTFHHDEASRIEDVIAVMYSMFQQVYPSSNQFHALFAVTPEVRKQAIFNSVVVPALEGCGGFITTYTTWCKYCKTLTDQRFVSVFSHSIMDCNLTPFLDSNIKVAIRPLFASLMYNAHFTSLEIENYSFNKESLLLFAEILRANAAVKRIAIRQCNLDGDDTTTLLRALSENSSTAVIHIDLSGNHIGEKGLQTLSQLVARLPHTIKHIDLHDCNCSRTGPFINAVLEHQCDTLTHLDLSNNRLDGEGSTALSGLITRSSTLSSLILRGACGINWELSYQSSSLKHLELSNVPSYLRVANTLSSMNSLTSLTISNSLVGMELIRGAFLEKLSLQRFDLHDSITDPDTFAAICAQLAKSHTLTALSLARLEPRMSASYKNRKPIECLADLLASACPLQELDVTAHPRNPLRKDVLPLVFGAFCSKTLRSLAISGHQAGDALPTMLATLLQINKTVSSLQWDDNLTSTEGFRIFNIGFQVNQALTVMQLPLQDIARELVHNPHAADELRALLVVIQEHLARNQLATQLQHAQQEMLQQIPQMPQVPQMPQLAHVPQIPAMPQMLEMPQIPGMPQIPQMPTFPLAPIAPDPVQPSSFVDPAAAAVAPQPFMPINTELPQEFSNLGQMPMFPAPPTSADAQEQLQFAAVARQQTGGTNRRAFATIRPQQPADSNALAAEILQALADTYPAEGYAEQAPGTPLGEEGMALPEYTPAAATSPMPSSTV